MMIGDNTKISRRGAGKLALGAGALSALPGCASWGRAAQRRKIIDMHAHIFNASDLPLTEFAKSVLLSTDAGIDQAVVLAIVDLITTVYKPLAFSAERELARLERQERRSARSYVTDETVADKVAARISEVLESEGDGPPVSAEVAASYEALDALLIPEKDDLDGWRARRAARRSNLLRAIQSMERQETEKSDPRRSRNGLIDRLAVPVRILAWLALLTRPRDRILSRFLRVYEEQGIEIETVVGLLVDYDEWLGDAPGPLSAHRTQVNVMSAIAKKRKGVRLLTFAGFCPLKLAYERRGDGEAYFDFLKDQYAQGNVAGFKMYPPMGFFPLGNRGADYVGKTGIEESVVARWSAAHPDVPLGDAIEDALEEFYTWCTDAEVDAPILAHAGPGNISAANFIDRPSPEHWIKVRDAYPGLRLCLGHFTNSAQAFIDNAVEPDGIPQDLWAHQHSYKLLADADGRQSTVFADLSFMSELLSEEAREADLALAFFKSLKLYCEAGDGWDPDFSQILYGSDWNMLGYVVGYQDHLSVMIDAMERAGYSDQAMDNILYNNAVRFLKL